ncbi:hypothetical protein KSP40_PGU015020 [Platanthera guangdongensis]|uniref:Uncharacterized protein n=1 Tax=Platanthera guangdongensis TaxID=2320717 RepID=A0ABR2M309_9ASPA
MICGISSFRHDDDDEGQSLPKSSKKKHRGTTATATANFNNGGNSKNPYSSRGLEKFTSVVSDLESRKEKILARTVSDGGDDVSMVRFKYSGTKEWVPIVVRRREDNGGKNNLLPSIPLSKLPEEVEKTGGKAEKKLRKHVTWNEGAGKK